MYIITEKRTILMVMLAGAIFILAIILLANMPFGDKDTARQHVSSLGWRIEQEPVETQKIEVPKEFDESYIEYNELQRMAGFDLAAYQGKTAMRYTFKIIQLNGADTLRANVLVYRGKVIGGDISTIEMEGFTMPLQKNKEQKGWTFN